MKKNFETYFSNYDDSDEFYVHDYFNKSVLNKREILEKINTNLIGHCVVLFDIMQFIYNGEKIEIGIL